MNILRKVLAGSAVAIIGLMVMLGVSSASGRTAAQHTATAGSVAAVHQTQSKSAATSMRVRQTGQTTKAQDPPGSGESQGQSDTDNIQQGDQSTSDQSDAMDSSNEQGGSESSNESTTESSGEQSSGNESDTHQDGPNADHQCPPNCDTANGEKP